MGRGWPFASFLFCTEEVLNNHCKGWKRTCPMMERSPAEMRSRSSLQSAPDLAGKATRWFITI